MKENVVFDVGGTKHGMSPFLPEELLAALTTGLGLTFLSELVVGLIVGGVVLFSLFVWRKKDKGRPDYAPAFLRVLFEDFEPRSPAEPEMRPCAFEVADHRGAR